VTAPRAHTLRRASGYVASEGENIYFERTGEGPPLVLCHGLGGNHAIWWRQIEALAARHEVITWDQRGFGNSTARSGDIGPPAARRDLRAILDHLGIDHVSLVGQSMGGWTALGYAQANPDRTRSLVLSTTIAGGPRSYVDSLVRAEPDRDRLNRREHPVLSAEFCRNHPDLGVLYNQISSFGTRPDPAKVLTAMAEDRLDLLPLEELRVPTLVLMASEDMLCPPSAMTGFVSRLPKGRLQVIRGGHSAYYETPEIWNEPVLAFVSANCGPA
jgi:pimeloyl-ACP methyl ester carboxylesterase